MRSFYIQNTIQHGWARSVLAAQIDTKLHARQGAAPTNFSLTLPPLTNNTETARNASRDRSNVADPVNETSPYEN